MSLKLGHDVTFHEFVRYLGDQVGNENKLLNAHWQPFSDLCKPCQVGTVVSNNFNINNSPAPIILQKEEWLYDKTSVYNLLCDVGVTNESKIVAINGKKYGI